MKGRHTYKRVDDMLEEEIVQVEFDDDDRCLYYEIGFGEEFNKDFDRKYNRLLHYGTPDKIASDIKRVVSQLMVKAGHPAAKAKIFVSLKDHTFRYASDDEWKEGEQDGDRYTVGTRGLNWWLGRYENDRASEEYKLMMLLRAALELEQASTTEDREMAIFNLGKVDERLKLHNQYLAKVKTGRSVKDGASKGAAAAKANNKETADRLAQMIELVEQKNMSVSAAAKKLEKQRKGSAEANRKLYSRAQKKKEEKSWDIPHDVPNRWFS